MDRDEIDVVQRGNELIGMLRTRTGTAGSCSGPSEVWNQIIALVPDLNQAAESGRHDAQALLGGICLEFLDDKKNALRLFKLAADGGDPAGMRGLGYMLASGIGVARDLRRATELFEAAAAAGDAFAAFNLAAALERSEHDAETEARIVELLQIASEGGVDQASLKLAELANAAGDQPRARRLYERAAGQGSLAAIQVLASWCRDGIGGPVDVVEAIGWYLRMLDYGNGDGVHEAIQLAKGMAPAEIRRAAEIAGCAAAVEALIEVACR